MARVDAWAHSLDIIVRLDRDRVGSDIGSGSDNGKARQGTGRTLAARTSGAFSCQAAERG